MKSTVHTFDKYAKVSATILITRNATDSRYVENSVEFCADTLGD